ncbi:MAG: GGDEF domain-containing protein [Anaerolineales bacterium]
MQNIADVVTQPDLEKIFERLHAAIAVIEKDGSFFAWNSAFEPFKKIIGNSFTKQLIETRWQEVFSFDKDDVRLCECFLIPASNERFILLVEPVASDSASAVQIQKLHKQVKLFQVESEFSKKLAHNKHIELESVITQAKEVSQTDALTFIRNRRAIINELQNEVLRAERYNAMLSISIIDVDHFKSINDSFGHPVGDVILQQVAHCLRDGIRHPDIVGRYGGEEFLIILPSSDIHAASEQATRLGKMMRESPIIVKEHVIQVTLSIGIAQLKISKDTWQTLLNRADNAMYEAKNKGRDCFVAAE